jgi:alpha-mannosidase
LLFSAQRPKNRIAIKLRIMKRIITFIILLPLFTLAQRPDTLQGFAEKISGEPINYYSPLKEFAKTALLTRCNGNMPISFKSPEYNGNSTTITYEFLIGHSTGTSAAERHFDIWLNDVFLFTLTTPLKKNGYYELTGGNDTAYYKFLHLDYDANNDAFGTLYITVPAALVKNKAAFKISGKNENSADWLMVFMYRRTLKIIAEPTLLVTNKENKRQVNIYLDNPAAGNSILQIENKINRYSIPVKQGYNKISLPMYDIDFKGKDTISFSVNAEKTIQAPVEIKPVKNFVFNIIHHSHNDIGYSHLQSEVAVIQNDNIKAAIEWIRSHPSSTSVKPYWHIESLWAVENFLSAASKEETNLFIKAVKSGQLVLSANYANILTGLCRKDEQQWTVEYAKKLERQYGITISNAMITDVPGIIQSALEMYVKNSIPYLSLGPNYIESLPDHGDRVGGVINEQGDNIFYWKPNSRSKQKLLVWTAGKGYSFFHGVSNSEQQQKWEQKITQYANELIEKNYPYEEVQLRYTKKSDNGPVDTGLVAFVENWNRLYRFPKLKLSSVNELFDAVEKKYAGTIPLITGGEISPYWEDGAYSTAVEENAARDLVTKTLALEQFLKTKNKMAAQEAALYQLHKNLVLFHEHTWGAWCSVSNPESDFTKQQWQVKKGFLDTAQTIYRSIAQAVKFNYLPVKNITDNRLPITDIEINPANGAVSNITVDGKNIVANDESYMFFEAVYAAGVNPTTFIRLKNISAAVLENSADKKTVKVTGILPGIQNYSCVYTLFKKEKRVLASFSFDKAVEKNKESLHIALPFSFGNPVMKYGSTGQLQELNKSQLPGSNRDFICAEETVELTATAKKAVLRFTGPNLVEVGTIIDETTIEGGKKWKKQTGNTSRLFLYVFNNYWHTNYKAWQEGHFDFTIELSFEKLQ